MSLYLLLLKLILIVLGGWGCLSTIALADTTSPTSVITTPGGPDCSCYGQKEFFINKSDAYNSLDLYPVPDYSQCQQAPCLNCTYKIRTQFYFNTDAVFVHYNPGYNYYCNKQVLLTNCKSNNSMLTWISNSDHIIDHQFNTQENELCLTFTSRSPKGYCDFSYGCYWYLKFRYVEHGTEDFNFNKLALKHYILQPKNPYSIIDLTDVTKNYTGFSMTTTNNNTLEFWSGSTRNASLEKAFVYDAPNLTNYLTVLLPWKNFDSIIPRNGSLTLTKPYESGNNYQFLWRIPELHSANCNDTKNFEFAFPYNATFTKSISAKSSGECKFTILMPSIFSANSYYRQRILPILHILSVNYVGNGSVKVISDVGFDPNPILEYNLFEISQENAKYWIDSYVYGNLLNFVIPPGGQLSLVFQSNQTGNTTNNDKTFDDYGKGIIQSDAYPLASAVQGFNQLIQCSKGVASFQIDIISADIQNKSCYLKIFGDTNLIATYKEGRINATLVFNATQVIILYDTGIFGPLTNGLLIHYEGKFIGSQNDGGQNTSTTQVTSTSQYAITSHHTSGSSPNSYGMSWFIVLPYVDSQTANSCQCYSNASLYLNSSDSNNQLTLYPTTSDANQDVTCSPCISCMYKIHTDFYEPGDALDISFELYYSECQVSVTLTNCKNDNSMLTYLTEWYSIGDGSNGSLWREEFYSQEADLCVNFTSNSPSGTCVYDEEEGCYWSLGFKYELLDDTESETGLFNFALNNSFPVSTFNLQDIDDEMGITIMATTGTLELISMCLSNWTGVHVYVFDAANLTNYKTSLIYADSPMLLTSQTGSFSLEPPIDDNEYDFHLLFRIREVHSAHCNNTNNYNFAMPAGKSFSSSIAASNDGSCMYTIIPQRFGDDFYDGTLPIVHISSINYIGNSSIKVSSLFGFNGWLPDPSNDLFEVTQENSKDWDNVQVFGRLINILIPPGGVLNIIHESRDLQNTTLYDDVVFNDKKSGVVQTLGYPYQSEWQRFNQYISCAKGLANFQMKIVYADIPDRGYMRIFGDNKMVKEYRTNILHNETIEFNATHALIIFDPEKGRKLSTGVLLRYEGKFIG